MKRTLNLQRYQTGTIINHDRFSGAKVRFIRRMRGNSHIIVEVIDYDHPAIRARSRLHIAIEQFELSRETP